MELTHARAKQMLKHWKMENETIRDLYYESSGNRDPNAVYVGEGYVLKRTCEPAGMQISHALETLLKETGMDTQTPVAAQNGETCVEADGWYYCLYRRMKGTELTAASLYGADGENRARFVGEVIGQLHLALQTADIQGKESDLLGSVQNWALPKAKQILHLPDDFCQRWLADFQKLYPLLPRQIIHRDPNPGNILSGEESWGMINFDMAERNIRLFDPCYAATAVLSESFDETNEKKLNEWLGICRSILTGYDSVVRLTEPEQEAIPYVLLANQLVCVAWFSGQPQFAEIAQTNCRMTLWLISCMDQLHI